MKCRNSFSCGDEASLRDEPFIVRSAPGGGGGEILNRISGLEAGTGG